MEPAKGHHPYLSGNYAPIHKRRKLTPCPYEGEIPPDLAGGQYIRNGANPLTNHDLGRDAHWFDGDGMLTGVLFKRLEKKGDEDDDKEGARIEPQFVNQYLLTDVHQYASASPYLRRPVLPSIATLVSPAKVGLMALMAIMRSVLLCFLSHLPGRPSIRKISVANTSVIYHDGRALATCESGPPLRFALPSLETIGWFNGTRTENEISPEQGSSPPPPGFGGKGPLAWMREWTTAHPRVDPVTNEFIAFHSTFTPPYVRYSVVQPAEPTEPGRRSRLSVAVPGIETPKMMHDFGVSRGHTVIMDLPLTLDPKNQMRGMPSLCYDATMRSRFGVFPRHDPGAVQFFETNPCLIFHTANCWDTTTTASTPGTKRDGPAETVVNLLACRLTSAATIFSSANLPCPAFKPVPPEYAEEEQCRLYYYSFPLAPSYYPGGQPPTHIRDQWALSAIPFEFPTLPPGRSMRECRYVYGCSTTESFTVALGKAAKVDLLAKMDVRRLIERGKRERPPPIKGCVDARSVRQVARSGDPDDAIKLFEMPPGWYAQEPRFVPRAAGRDEDDGWLLTYVFDESQLEDRHGKDCDIDSDDNVRSELWVIDARGMKDVVARIKLPQRVPYGLHGDWFTGAQISGQRPFDAVREDVCAGGEGLLLDGLRNMIERWVG